jgi:hypothetical protein
LRDERLHQPQRPKLEQRVVIGMLDQQPGVERGPPRRPARSSASRVRRRSLSTIRYWRGRVRHRCAEPGLHDRLPRRDNIGVPAACPDPRTARGGSSAHRRAELRACARGRAIDRPAATIARQVRPQRGRLHDRPGRGELRGSREGASSGSWAGRSSGQRSMGTGARSIASCNRPHGERARAPPAPPPARAGPVVYRRVGLSLLGVASPKRPFIQP